MKKNISNQESQTSNVILNVDDKPITSSPFYDGIDANLPNGSLVKPSGLYMMDDSGGIIYQLTNTQDDSKKKIVGSIDLSKRIATIEANSIASATSYKKLPLQNPPSNTSPYVDISNGLLIKYLTKIAEFRRAPLNKGFKVEITVEGKPSHYFLYTVNSKNGQLTVTHTIRPFFSRKILPEKTIDGTSTAVHGMVFLEYNGHVYSGFLESASIFLEDPHGIFRDGPDTPTLEA